MERKFDLIALGTGSAASAVASRCRSAGWQVAVVDSRPFGGTCALRGCDPKKVLVGAAQSTDWTWRMKGNGVRAERLQIDWSELMHFKRTFTEPVPKSREEMFAKAGIEVFHQCSFRWPIYGSGRRRDVGGTIRGHCNRPKASRPENAGAGTPHNKRAILAA